MKQLITFGLLLLSTSAYALNASGSNLDSSPNQSQTVAKGIADLHVHMFANDGFAGGWFTGDPAAEHEALFEQCENGETWPWLKAFVEDIDPYISSFLVRDHCVPKSKSFPKWNDLAHQQVWGEDLKKAKESGLSLMVMSSVHSYTLCQILPDSRKRFESCEDQGNHLRQLQNAKQMIEQNDWIELATSPEDARRIISEDKLAVVFSVESSNLFEGDDWQKEFQNYWNLGVRSLQIVHQFDNEAAGAAVHKEPLRFAHYLRNWMRFGSFKGFDLIDQEYETDFGTRTITKNTKGLTEKGANIIEHMMASGMPIDFAHMSEKTMNDVIEILSPKDYPFYISHGHFRDVMKDGLGRFEKSSSKEVLQALKAADGIFGVRTITYATHQYDESIQNNCDGSALSFAQMLRFGQDMDINIALGSDFNGFIPQTRPRFSDTDTAYCPDQKVPRTNTHYDVTGLGKVNQIGDLLLDLKNIGVDTHKIENSTEKFLQVWERSYLHSSIIL